MLRTAEYKNIDSKESKIEAKTTPNPLKKDNLINLIFCPITTQIFYDPVTIDGCGHAFEREAIKQWQHSGKTNCPCCKGTILGLSAAPIINSLTEEILAANPELHSQRYYSLANLRSALNSGDVSKLDKLIKILISSDNLNVPSDEKEFQGLSAFSLLLGTPAGINILSRHEKLREKITAETLNHPSERNITPVFLLTKDPVGIDLLAHDAKLTAKIASDSLNAITSGGASAIYNLTFENSGLTLLSQNEELRAKANIDGLNSIIQSGPERGLSAIYTLTLDAQGMTLLANDEKLTAKITSEGLNSIGQEGKYRGDSTLFSLCASPEGRLLLLKNRWLCELINIETLMCVLQDGECKGQSAYKHLLSTKEGPQILENNPRLQARIKIWEQGSHAFFTRETRPQREILLPREYKSTPAFSNGH